MPNAWTGDAGKGPAPYQREIMEALPAKRRVAVRGPHGLGKTALASWMILWFALTRDGADWKIITTASRLAPGGEIPLAGSPQVDPAHIRWGKVGREPFNQNELLTLQPEAQDRSRLCRRLAITQP